MFKEGEGALDITHVLPKKEKLATCSQHECSDNTLPQISTIHFTTDQGELLHRLASSGSLDLEPRCEPTLLTCKSRVISTRETLSYITRETPKSTLQEYAPSCVSAGYHCAYFFPLNCSVRPSGTDYCKESGCCLISINDI